MSEPVSRFANLKRIEFTQSLLFWLHKFFFLFFNKRKQVTLICAPGGEFMHWFFVEKGTHKVHWHFDVHENDIRQYIVDFEHYLALREAGRK